MAPRASKRKKHSVVKNYLVPHEGNEYQPKLFRTAAVVALLIGIVAFEGLYIIDTKLAQNNTSFLASVLPGALLGLTNSDRVANGVSALQEDPLLAKAAQLKANDMAEKGYFAHTSPEGKSPWYWLDAVGYSYSYAGENLAINFNDSSEVEQAWMNSPTHHANIVKAQYTRVGYAVAQGMYQGKMTTFVVQEFATNPADATITKSEKPKSTAAKIADSVLGTKKPVEETVPTISTSTNSVGEAGAEEITPPEVLGTETGQTFTRESGVTNFLKQIAASPMRTSTYVLSGLALLIIILLAYALIAHARVRYLEVLGGGLIVIIFSLSVLVYNSTHSPVPSVPTGSASTSTNATSP